MLLTFDIWLIRKEEKIAVKVNNMKTRENCYSKMNKKTTDKHDKVNNKKTIAIKVNNKKITVKVNNKKFS